MALFEFLIQNDQENYVFGDLIKDNCFQHTFYRDCTIEFARVRASLDWFTEAGNGSVLYGMP